MQVHYGSAMSNPVLDAYTSGISQIADLLTYAPKELNVRPAPDQWSASQVLAHLADAEISIALRIRMMLTTDDYQFSSWDEDLFANLNPNRSPTASVAAITALRRANLDLLAGLDSDALNRTGMRQNGSPISVIDYLAMMNQHTLDHLEQAQSALVR
jgi:hypothetical protein